MSLLVHVVTLLVENSGNSLYELNRLRLIASPGIFKPTSVTDTDSLLGKTYKFVRSPDGYVIRHVLEETLTVCNDL